MKAKRLTPLLILAVFLAGWMLGRNTGGRDTIPEAAAAQVAVASTAAPETSSPKLDLRRAQGAAAVTTPVPTPEKQTAEHDYVLNTNTHKFHEPDCYSVDQMKDSNKKYYTGTRDEIIEMGYEPCGNCRP